MDRVAKNLTKLRSVAAGEGAHGGGRKDWSHGKLVRTPASGWLHRLVRLFVIHAFDCCDCRLDEQPGSRVSEMWSIPGRSVTGTSLPAVLKTARKLIGVKHFIILTGQNPKRLPDRTNVCLVVALGPEILL